ncbi:MAG: hypothetical protein Q9P44_17800 [Anaerolineae bacterium]|nr:hypothetical protein [Anaerolineae bacterium]
MFGLISGKVYVFIALITSALLYAVEFFDKNEVVVNWLNEQMTRASGSGLGRAASGFIAKPLIFAIDDPVGAVLGGLLWPFLILWLLFLVLLLTFSFIAPGIFKARCAASADC